MKMNYLAAGHGIFALIIVDCLDVYLYDRNMPRLWSDEKRSAILEAATRVIVIQRVPPCFPPGSTILSFGRTPVIRGCYGYISSGVIKAGNPE
jgi:hypothetical protein